MPTTPNVIYVMRIPEKDRVDEASGKLIDVYKLILLTTSPAKPAPIPFPLSGITGVDQNANTTTLPTIGDSLSEAQPLIFCSNLTAYRGNDPIEVFVEVEWTPFTINGDTTGRYNISISGSGVKSTFKTTRWAADNDGPAGASGIIVTSANEPFAPQDRPAYDLARTITYQCGKAQFATDSVLLDAMIGCMNNADLSFTILGVAFEWDKYQVLMDNWRFAITVNPVVYTTTEPYFTVTMDLLIRADSVYGSGDGLGWKVRLADRGTIYLDGSGNPAPIKISNNGNLYASEPQPLDGSGHVLTLTSSIPEVLLPANSLIEMADFSLVNDFAT